ncbi:MAG: hypothetical protein IJ790_02110 [Lachnospiraceae bacterium]|nr:hypothetical protein [Lachnospiraceae bacterium]
MKCNESFKEFIATSKHYKEMQDFVSKSHDLCPEPKNVFRFFSNDVSNAKCVILGMDPYPATYKCGTMDKPIATGRSFEVANIRFWTDKYRQTSLANIFKSLIYMKTGKIYTIEELRKKINKDNFRYIDIHDWFDAMEEEGVIFLNATLTTLKNKSDAHSKIWEGFMDELLRYMVTVNKDLIWLIWGTKALNRVKDIVDRKHIIYTCHPATRVNNTFVKDCPFKKIKIINWT